MKMKWIRHSNEDAHIVTNRNGISVDCCVHLEHLRREKSEFALAQRG